MSSKRGRLAYQMKRKNQKQILREFLSRNRNSLFVKRTAETQHACPHSLILESQQGARLATERVEFLRWHLVPRARDLTY